MPLLPDQELYEYRIARVLGQGAFGTVYLAHDTLLDRPVAIKELSVTRQTDEQAFDRFLREARTAGGMSHPGIVTVYALKLEEASVYLVMEYLAGGSLRTFLEGQGPLAVEQAVQIAADVCEGLAAAHNKGIVHRDIKPENILLTEDGRGKVGDFGIAHVPRAGEGTVLTQAGFQPGTLIYMSPEQVRGEQVDGRSDVYQIGALLYEMLRGQHHVDMNTLGRQAREEAGSNAALFQARLYEYLAEMICDRKPEPIHQVRVDVPEWLSALVMVAMAKSREERPSSQELARALYEKQVLYLGKLPDSIPDAISRAQDHFYRGARLLEQQRYDEAIQELQYALRLDDHYVEARLKLGSAYIELFRLEDAVRECQAVLAIDPYCAEAYVFLGKIYYMQAHLAESIQVFQAALRTKPGYAEAHVGLGMVYEFQRNLDKAAREYEAAIKVDPSDAETHYKLSGVYALQDRPEASNELRLAAQLGFKPAQYALSRFPRKLLQE